MLLSSLTIAAQQKDDFNGMMSTYGDSSFGGHNGIMEIVFDDETNKMNGVITIVEPDPTGKSGPYNGLMDTFADTVLSSVPAEPRIFPMRNDIMPEKIATSFFEINSANITRHSLNALREILGLLKSESIRQIIIYGYADSSGPAAFNQRISQMRADAVKRWLVQNGIPSTIITAQGLGPQELSADETPAQLRRADVWMEIK